MKTKTMSCLNLLLLLMIFGCSSNRSIQNHPQQQDLSAITEQRTNSILHVESLQADTSAAAPRMKQSVVVEDIVGSFISITTEDSSFIDLAKTYGDLNSRVHGYDCDIHFYLHVDKRFNYHEVVKYLRDQAARWPMTTNK